MNDKKLPDDLTDEERQEIYEEEEMRQPKLPEGMTQKDLEELDRTTKEALENPISGFKKIVKSILKPWKRKDKIEATYQVFKPYYDRAGKKFTHADAKIVRENVLRLSRKMFEIEIEGNNN